MKRIPKLIVLGRGGHAKVLLAALMDSRDRILGFVDRSGSHESDALGIPMLGDDDVVLQYDPKTIELVNGVGFVGADRARELVYDKFIERGYRFARVVHPGAIVAKNAILNEGAQVMAGAVIQPGSVVGANSIVNTNATVDHDCRIANHAHIAPGATLSGGVSIGEGTLVGAGATVIQGISIGARCVVAAGAVVVRDVPARVVVAGVPAKILAGKPGSNGSH